MDTTPTNGTVNVDVKDAQPNLSSILGVKLDIPDEGFQNLKKFHERYPLETIFDSAVPPTVLFSAHGMSFKITADINQDADTVYQSSAITYLPTTVVFVSEWHLDLADAVGALKEFIQAKFKVMDNADKVVEQEPDNGGEVSHPPRAAPFKLFVV